MNEVKKNFSKWMYWFVLGVCVILVYKILDNFGVLAEAAKKFLGIVSPFLVGLLLAYILYIPASGIERALKNTKSKIIRKKARGISILISYIIAILIIIILVNVILPVVIQSITELINNLQGYYDTVLQKYSEIPDDSFLKSEKVRSIIDSLKNQDFKDIISFDTILQYAKGAISIVYGLLDVFVTIIVSVYTLLERGKILKFLKKLSLAIFGENTTRKISKYFNNTNQIFFKFLISQFLDAVIVGVILTIVLSIMKVKYAVLIGFLIGLFNMIPYFGALAAGAISILITIITGGISKAIWMAIAVVIIQQIDANIVNPKIVGDSLEISPLLIIFSVTVGGAYFGIVGMFLAVPVVAVIKILIDDYINFKIEKNKTKE